MTGAKRNGSGRKPVEIRLCSGSGCVALGALDILESIRSQAAHTGLEVIVNARSGFVGCRGFCSQGPLVHFPEVDLLYCRVTPEDVLEILETTVGKGEAVERLLYLDPVSGVRSRGVADNPFFFRQERRVLARCGVVDPEDIDHAMALGAYDGLRTAVEDLDGMRIIDLVKRSGLQERGGTGFPVGLKWAVVAESDGDPKFVVGNGESGDPGLGADRTLLEGDPHSLVEGMVIAAMAVGARAGRFFLRSDHGLGIARAERAIAQARDRGFLGHGILGSEIDFDIEICESAGKSMGGEETAMLNALEGRRGTARPRPPFPAVCGLWGRPTLINNLETLANVPAIVSKSVADGPSPVGHTKIVALSGRAPRSGLAEVSLGTPIWEILSEIAGIVDPGEVQAVHLGGPGGSTLGSEQLETTLDISSLRNLGVNLGAGGMVILGPQDCPVALVRNLVARGSRESCGTCPPCRIGTQVMLKLLDRIESGGGDATDLDRLERLAEHIRRTSLCEVGRGVSVSVLAGLGNFRATFESRLSGEESSSTARR